MTTAITPQPARARRVALPAGAPGAPGPSDQAQVVGCDRSSSAPWSRSGSGSATASRRRAPARADSPPRSARLTALLGTYAVLVAAAADVAHRVARTRDRTRPARGLAPLDRLRDGVAARSRTSCSPRVGYAQGAHVSLWAQTRDFISHYPDVLMAWVGFALFLAVAVTSVRIARRKLKRQTWYFVHLYAYLAVALTFAHQLAVGTDFSDDRAARVWWIGLYVARRRRDPVVARHRAVAPQPAPRPARALGEARGAGRRVDPHPRPRSRPDRRASPGQFFLWRFLTPAGWWQAHPFSLSAAPDDEPHAHHGEGPRRPHASGCSTSGPAYACSPKARTARSPPSAAPGAACC